MKAVVAAFNQEKALVGAFSVISNLRMELFQALIYTGHVAGVPAGGDVLRQQDGEGVAAVQDQRLLRAPVVRGQGWPLAVIAADIDNLQQCSAVRREEPSSLRNHLFRMSLFPVQR